VDIAILRSLFTKVVLPWNVYLHNIHVQYTKSFMHLLYIIPDEVLGYFHGPPQMNNNEPQNFMFGTSFSPPQYNF